MKTARVITVAERDAELEQLLRVKLRTMELHEPCEGAVLAPLVRYGACFPAHVVENAAHTALQRFIENTGGGSAAATHATILAEDVEPDESAHEYAFECIRPGNDWPEKHRALFWRLLAAAHSNRHSDSMLNLQATALDQAIPWHVRNEPAVAVLMLVRRARILGYASYGWDEMEELLDVAADIHATTPLPPHIEYDFLVQACDVIDWGRTGLKEDFPRTSQLLRLALRGLQLGDILQDPPQLARLYHCVADALVRSDAGDQIDSATLDQLEARFGAKPAAAVAELAWSCALELEDGRFHEPEARSERDLRMQQRKQQYQGYLVALAQRRASKLRPPHKK